MSNKSTICLSMIVKNEAHCITKCLESVKPIINHWVISDTGSTDNTEEVIKEFLKDIPGEYIHNEWKDFSTNRNIALDLAKQKAEYVFIIDADDSLIIEDKGICQYDILTHPSYNLKIKHGSITYHRPLLIKSSTPCKFIGILHEYLDLADTPATLCGSYSHFGANGNRSKSPDKYKKDAETFVKALETDPNNSRYLFYCAQSFRDANDLPKALEYYQKRAEIPGWIEENYIALFEIAKIYEEIDPDKVEIAYLKAHNLMPTRAEALCYLAKFYRKRNEFEKGYFYALCARNIFKPGKALFLEDACYSWIPLDEMAVCGYYIGKRKWAEIVNEQLIKDPDVPEYQKVRLKDNLAICQEKNKDGFINRRGIESH